jgi:ABC-type transport system involved in cytochrome bd biosynthesis fused ATPase/permease subunit
MRLSGGERQRVPCPGVPQGRPHLALDEPTSSVIGRRRRSSRRWRLMAGRTTIMIAHRLTTLDECDAGWSCSRRQDESQLPMSAPAYPEELAATHLIRSVTRRSKSRCLTAIELYELEMAQHPAARAWAQ